MHHKLHRTKRSSKCILTLSIGKGNPKYSQEYYYSNVRKIPLIPKDFVSSKIGLIIAHDGMHYDSLILPSLSQFNLPWLSLVACNLISCLVLNNKCTECKDISRSVSAGSNIMCM